MADPKDFLLSTDYEMDKIVYFKSGDFIKTTSFKYNLNFKPLVFGVWSTDSDFSNSNPLGATAVDVDPFATPPLGVSVVVENDTIRITSHGDGENTTKVYYRVYAFEPHDSKQSAPHTSSAAKNFVLNTDYNYRKLKEAGVFTQNGQEYDHNLGYLPHVEAWLEFKPDFLDGQIQPLVFASEFTEIYLTITTNKIKVSFPSAWVEKVHWRLYYDET